MGSDALELVAQPSSSQFQHRSDTGSIFSPFEDDLCALQVHTIWLQKACAKEEKFTEESKAEAQMFEAEASELQAQIDEMHGRICEQRAELTRHQEQEEADRKVKEEQDAEADRLHKYIAMMENEAKLHRESLMRKLEDALEGPRREAQERMEAEEKRRAEEKGKQAFEVANNENKIKDLQRMIQEKQLEVQAQQERFAGNKILDALSLLQLRRQKELRHEAMAKQRQILAEHLEQHHKDYEEALGQQAEEIETETESQAIRIQNENEEVAAQIETLRGRLEREQKRTRAATRRADVREAQAKEEEKKAEEAKEKARAENAVRRAQKEKELLNRLKRPSVQTVARDQSAEVQTVAQDQSAEVADLLLRDQIAAVGDQIGAVKEKLQSQGLSDARIDSHPEVKDLVEKQQALRARPVDVKVDTPRAAFPVLGVLRHVEHQLGSLNGAHDILGGLNAEIAALEAEIARNRR